MRTFTILLATLALGACSKSSSPAPAADQAKATPPAAAAAAGPARRAIDCAAILKGTAEQGHSVYTPGGWGKLPAELQVLPPGAELCGSGGPTGAPDKFPGVLIRSPLFGPALGDFYAPLLTKMGCTVKPVEVVGSGDMQSTRGHYKCGDKSVDLGTDTGYEFYFLAALI
jgi:hypothetical protein